MERQAWEERARKEDAQDPLSAYRSEFYRPLETIYLDGNSLGLLSRQAEAALLHALEEWRSLGVGAWGGGDPAWFHLAERIGALEAPLVGAEPEEVVATASTTLNLHQLLSTFYRPDGARRVLLCDPLNFPSDRYAIESHLRLRGEDPAAYLREVPSRDGRTLSTEDTLASLGEDVALVVLPAVLYRSGQLLDVRAVTEAAHARGALIGWDLSHAAGAVPLQLHDDGADFAFWCNYKYLGGGPGAAASLFVHRRHFDRAPGLWGWFGSRKDRQFDMLQTFEASSGAGAYQTGTPHILAMAPLLGALALIGRAGITAIREKSLRQTSLLIEMGDDLLRPLGFAIGTPRAVDQRGAHVAFEHPEAARIARALKACGVVPDFRPPNVVRLGPNPLYTSFSEIARAVVRMLEVVESGVYLRHAAEREEIA